ncbi:hypothetical protein DSUL_100044 [Desulfovibrionales bacterium]
MLQTHNARDLHCIAATTCHNPAGSKRERYTEYKKIKAVSVSVQVWPDYSRLK